MATTVRVGKTVGLTAKFVTESGSEDTAGTLSWSSDLPGATVNATGSRTADVTGVSAGDVHITSTLVDEDGNRVVSDPYTVTVTDGPAAGDAVSGTISESAAHPFGGPVSNVSPAVGPTVTTTDQTTPAAASASATPGTGAPSVPVDNAGNPLPADHPSVA